jgi:hypothetical protein
MSLALGAVAQDGNALEDIVMASSVVLSGEVGRAPEIGALY